MSLAGSNSEEVNYGYIYTALVEVQAQGRGMPYHTLK